MENQQSKRQLALLWLVQLLVVFLIAGEPVPGINESHYLTKARHYFDGEFASGDLFLESHDSHLASTLVAGLLSTFLPLAAVAWIGRLLCWSFLSWAWLQFTEPLRLPLLLRPVGLAAWYYAVFYGHWAGEWAVGGFEGKALAYPCVLVALGCLMRDRLKPAWISRRTLSPRISTTTIVISLLITILSFFFLERTNIGPFLWLTDP